VADSPPLTHGLSGDLGWNENDEDSMRGHRAVLLVVASGVYYASVWLLSGLAPLGLVASRIRRGRGNNGNSWLDHGSQRN
jgi:hypothetical protein